MSRVFISYRRQDAGGHAGRVYDGLIARLGKDNVFLDVGSISPGDPFAEVLERTLTEIDVMVVVIGPGWLTAQDPAGHRRLDDPGDYIRMEVGRALARDDVRVIPVRVAGAGLPPREELPPALRTLADRQAVELTDERWPSDFDQLAAAIASPRRRKAKRTQPAWWRGRRGLAIAGAAIAVIVAVIVALVLAGGGDDGSGAPEQTAFSATFSPGALAFDAPNTVPVTVQATKGPFFVQFVHTQNRQAEPPRPTRFVPDDGDCTSTLDSGQSCTARITFDPNLVGPSGDVMIIRLRGGERLEGAIDPTAPWTDLKVNLTGAASSGSSTTAATPGTPSASRGAEVAPVEAGAATTQLSTVPDLSGVRVAPKWTVDVPQASGG